MPALGITGGIATGKSLFARVLGRHLPITMFDADACSHELLATDTAIQNAVRVEFGREVFDGNGRPDRTRLRDIIFAEPDKRRALEAILHPAIRARWSQEAVQAAQRPEWFSADIPLLYETGAEMHFAAIVVVACAPATQRERLTQERGLAPSIAENIIATQLDLATKMSRADHVIWNDGTFAPLERQACALAAYLQHRFHHV